MPLTINANITVHMAADPAILQRLRAIELKADHIIAQGEKLMEVTQAVKAVLDQIDAETNRIATAVDALVVAATDGMDPAEAAPIIAQGQAIVARLQGIAANPAEPVPPVEPLPA